MKKALDSQHTKDELGNENGFVLALTGLSLFVLVLMAGFAVDLGSWYLSASKLQRASDAAALAGAAALPDTNAAAIAVKDSYRKNGLVEGPTITFNTTITKTSIQTSATNKAVATYFVKAVMPSMTISRTSEAQQSNLAPVLGSPFNVLGTGDLSIPNIPKQNFWLAVNNVCSPKEDGDYFSAYYDKNKGPFLSSYITGTKQYQSAATGVTKCPQSGVPDGGTSAMEKNQNYDPNGYSYFVNIPPNNSGSVAIKIYDPAFTGVWSDGACDAACKAQDTYPDVTPSMANDGISLGDVAYNVFDPDGVSLLNPSSGKPIAVNTADTATPRKQWWTIATIPAAKAALGGEYRIQIFTRPLRDSGSLGTFRGANAFSIGAFASWNGSGNVGCSAINNPTTCPRVYGRNAISVLNNLEGLASGSTADFYFAQVDPNLAGTTFNVMLWDPGEGVTKMELLAPNDTPLAFTWKTADDKYSDTNAGNKSIDTSGLDSPPRPSLSNPYKFNDRLLVMSLTIPSNYPDMVVNGNTYLKIRYTVSGSPNDRTTWGIAFPDSNSGAPPHLTTYKP